MFNKNLKSREHMPAERNTWSLSKLVTQIEDAIFNSYGLDG